MCFNQIEKLTDFLQNQGLHQICVTGKMASGKNHVCALLEQKGWKSIDADLIVHKAIETPLAKNQIIKNFGEECKKRGLKLLNPDNSINRRELGKLLFEKTEYLAVQEQILYPIVIQMIQTFVQENPKAIINATVLYKTPVLLEKCQALVYVKAGLFTRIIRARKRDKLSLKQILKRYASQKSLFTDYSNALNQNQQLIIFKN